MDSIWTLIAVAAGLGILHTIAGPDHYLPFVALGSSRGWGLARTLLITVICGSGHMLSSIIIGLIGGAIGAGAGAMDAGEDVVKWLFLAFAVAYLFYGFRRAFLGLTHCHGCELSADSHGHFHEHFSNGDKASFAMLFFIFLLGPCEILFPLMMYPSAKFDWIGALCVAFAFSASTLLTMVALVAALFLGAKALRCERLEKWSDAIAGVVLVACALFMFYC